MDAPNYEDRTNARDVARRDRRRPARRRSSPPFSTATRSTRCARPRPTSPRTPTTTRASSTRAARATRSTRTCSFVDGRDDDPRPHTLTLTLKGSRARYKAIAPIRLGSFEGLPIVVRVNAELAK